MLVLVLFGLLDETLDFAIGHSFFVVGDSDANVLGSALVDSGGRGGVHDYRRISALEGLHAHARLSV